MEIKKPLVRSLATLGCAAGIILAVIAVAGCTTTTSTAGTTTTATTATATTTGGVGVEISNLAFKPSTVTISVGTTVTWTNQDNFAHTVTSTATSGGTNPDGRFGSGDLFAGDHFSFTFTQAGTYYYYCKHHPSMQGTVVVS